jgi:hypothetical protein
MTIVVKSTWDKRAFELLSKTYIPRKKRFYIKDKKGYYYIPEVVNKLYSMNHTTNKKKSK